MQFRCTYCQNTIQVPDSAEGQAGTCRQCGNQIIVPFIEEPQQPRRAIPIQQPSGLADFSVKRVAILLSAVVIPMGVISILMFAGLLPTSGGTERSKTRPARSTAPFVLAPFSRAPELITLAKFNQLQQGISYQEAVRVMGKEGTVMSESEIANIYTVMYSWQSNGIGNMNAVFQNGRMISKAQFGLK